MDLPDAKDGLTRLERIILVTLREASVELGKENVPLPMLYGRVLQRIDVSRPDFERALRRLLSRRAPL